MKIESFDTIQTYCRKLGHYVPFKYCRTVNDSLPCHKIKDCAFEKLPVEDFLQAHYSKDDMEKIFNPPADKISTLIDLIERAKKSS
ncbi:MAG: hypothetical protein MUC95_06605 [Spirochaetes bacterium]|jgi:hypothetical protein|nr:hypothetical protein [Spirochaetota bacterium]